MDLLLLANIIGSLFAITGSLCLVFKIKWGFLSFQVTEVCFMYIGFMTGNYGLVFTATQFLFINFYGWYRWKKQEN